MPAEKDDIETQDQGEGSAVLGKRAHEAEVEPAANGDDSGKETTRNSNSVDFVLQFRFPSR